MFSESNFAEMNDEREIDAQTTTSWLGAGIYVPPKNFPDMVEQQQTNMNRSRSGRSKTSSGSNGSKRNKSSKGVADDEKSEGGGFGDIQFVGGTEATKALVVATPPRNRGSKKPQRPSPTSTVEEQLQSLHDSFAKTLFGCQEDDTMLANAGETAKKNTRKYQQRNSSSNKSQTNTVVPRTEDKLTPNLSIFHTFGAACACIAETTNAPDLAKMISSGQSVIMGGVGGEEKKDDESLPSVRKKKTKKRTTTASNSNKNKPTIIVDPPPKPTQTLIPMEELIVAENSSPKKMSRDVSELTMRSSYARVHAPLPAQRRMAYYAVGKHGKHNAKGGNRRCYYSGKLIVGDNPFYAGCVKQGLRTLVVFCVPSALGLPKQQRAPQIKPERRPSFVKGIFKRSSSRLSSTSNATVATAIDSDMFVGAPEGEEEDWDVNRGLNKDYLLSVLPEPSDELLVLMKQKYPDEYRTLPDQVRLPESWRLYIQFCFFSGLPIAEGECYYMIKSEISQQDYGESIVLCHAIMEAVNGTSSDMVRLPNLKTFEYLKKHYPQQSEKLPASAFERSSWEVVLPEI